MAILKFDPNKSYLNISEEEINSCWDFFIQEFGVASKESVSIYGERYLRAVENRSKYLLQSTLDNDLAVEYLAARLAQKNVIRDFIGGRYSEARATAFVVLFVRRWVESSTSERKELRGRLVSSLKDSSKWSGLYFELIVGAVYLFTGVDVEYRNSGGGSAGKSADLYISKAGAVHSVEIKTINYSTGFPMDMPGLVIRITNLLEKIVNLPRPGEGFVVDVLYEGPRQPSDRAVSEALDNAADKLLGGENIFDCGGGFSIFSKTVLIDEVAAYENSLNGLNGQLSGFDLRARLNKNERAMSITFRSSLNWDITKRMSSLVRAATRQLEGQGVVWIQVCGLDPAGGNFKKLDEITVHNEFLQSECMKLEERGSLLVCHVAADTGAKFIDNELVLDLRHSMLGGGMAPPNVIQHYYDNFCAGRK